MRRLRLQPGTLPSCKWGLRLGVWATVTTSFKLKVRVTVPADRITGTGTCRLTEALYSHTRRRTCILAGHWHGAACEYYSECEYYGSLRLSTARATCTGKCGCEYRRTLSARCPAHGAPGAVLTGRPLPTTSPSRPKIGHAPFMSGHLQLEGFRLQVTSYDSIC